MVWKSSFSLLSQSDLFAQEVQHNVWPAVRKYIVRKIFTNKCCTFSIVTKSFSLYGPIITLLLIRGAVKKLPEFFEINSLVHQEFVLPGQNVTGHVLMQICRDVTGHFYMQVWK